MIGIRIPYKKWDVLARYCANKKQAAKYVLITPLNYFPAADLVAEKLDPLYRVIKPVLTAGFAYSAIRKFVRKDLL